MPLVTIEQLYVFPVKSLAGVAIDKMNASSSGLDHDRQWVILKPDNHPLTQRQHSKLALIDPEILNDKIVLHASGHPSLQLVHTTKAVDIQIWKDSCPGLLAADNCNEWITNVCNSNAALRLAKTLPDARRDSAHPQRFNINTNTYADAAPYLVANTASLDALNQRLERQGKPKADCRQFRANIWISGIPAFAEHDLSQLTSDNIHIDLVDHCSRCSMITIDPDTGKKLQKAAPFTDLASINSMPNNGKIPAFGVNSVLRSNFDVKLYCGQEFEAH